MKQFVELNDFKFRNSFIDLTDEQVQGALQMINAQFSGVYSLWSILPPRDACAKRELCINYLTAWKLTQLYPEQSIGVAGTGGIPLAAKRAGPISIRYKDMANQEGSVLSMLTTNQFGVEALTMIQSSPEMYVVYT